MSSFDVAVIGLGAMGSAALYELARRGKRVVGIERFQPGHENGSSHGESRVIRLAYFEHPSYVPLVRAALAKWRQLERASGETLLTATGVLQIGRPGSILVAGSLAACREHGLEHETLDAAAIRARFPIFSVPEDYSGLWEEEGGILRPERANAAHLRLASAAGAELLTGNRVQAIEPRSGHVRIVQDGAVIEAGAVVVTAGPWIADLVTALKPHLSLSRQVLCWYEPLSPELFRADAFPVFAIEGDDDIVYGFPDFAGTGVKCASHHAGETIGHADAPRRPPVAEDARRITDFVRRYIPAAPGRLLNMKTCIYTNTPTGDFVIDRAPDDERIVFASACSGHGYKFATVIGEALADLALQGGTRHDLSRFSLSNLRGVAARH